MSLYGVSPELPALEPLAKHAQAHLESNSNVDAHRLALTPHSKHTVDGKDHSLHVRLQDRNKVASRTQALAEPVATLEQQDNLNIELVVRYPPEILKDDPEGRKSLAPLIASELHRLFAEERAMITRLEEARRYQAQTSLEVLVKGREDEIERRQQRAMKYASTYHLTFSLFTPEASPSGWEIEAALAQTFRPLLDALSPICNFTIDTQLQPYAHFSGSVRPTYKQDRGRWELKASDLGGFINAAEWPLSPSIGAGPTINFLLYVPAASQTPLTIESAGSSSWLVLQWGGIAIHNPSHPTQLSTAGTLTADELREPFLTFSQHLLDLLGLPSPDLPFDLRLQSQKRILAVRLLSSASSTLGSLARLTQTLTSISIPDTVAASVDRTISHLESACAELNGGDFQAALDHARTADEEAEKAFFHKCMVGQVYFPDEHKVAVYLPLLGPVAVPLIMTALKELKAWLTSRKRSGGSA